MPPYSSTTMARWNLRSCISRMSRATRLVSGTKWAGRTKSRTGSLAVALALGPDEVLGVGDADDVVDVALVDREPGEAGRDGHAQGLGHRQVGLDGRACRGAAP